MMPCMLQSSAYTASRTSASYAVLLLGGLGLHQELGRDKARIFCAMTSCSATKARRKWTYLE